MPPIGTPGCTGGGAGRKGALYTGLGPVCGTIMRGTGSGGAVGRVGLELVVAADAETDGGAAGGGICAAGGGVTGRAGGATTGVDACGGTATGETARVVDGVLADTAEGGGAGFVGGGATVVGRLTPAGRAAAGFSAGVCAGGAAGRGGAGGAAASFFCVIALNTSPGREMFDRSILVLISSSPRSERGPDLPGEDEPSAEERMYTRTFSASCSSKELECVFFSVTPTSGRVSRIARLLTSSSRARSLIRTLLIRPFVSPCCRLGLHCDLTESIS